MAQRQPVSGRRSCVLYAVILAALALIAAGIALVVVVRPELDQRRQTEARLAEAERHYQAGVAFQKVGDWEAAETEFKQVITLYPNYKDTQTHLTEVKTRLTESEATATAEAIALAERARADTQSTATAQAQATATAQVVAATATMNAVETHYQKGLAYINLEQWVEAQAELQAVFEVDPNYKGVEAQLAVVNSEIAKLTPTPTPTSSVTPTPETPPTLMTPPTPQLENAASIEGSWEVVSFLPYTTEDLATLVTIVNDYIFVIGPLDPAKSGYATTDVLRAPILDNGEVGEWESTTPLPRKTLAGDVVAIDNTIYLFGGKAHGDQERPYNNVIYGTVKDDGMITAWNEAAPLPRGLRDPAAVVYGKTVYVIGGGQWHGKPNEYGRYHYDTLYQAIIKPDGSLSSWANANISAPIKGYFSAFALDNYLYVLAPGAHGSFVSEIAPDGALGSWERLGDTVIRSEVIVNRALYGVTEGRLSSVGISASHRFVDYSEGPSLPRPEGILLYSDGTFYFVSGDVIFALKNN